jgi:hypothetical protein
MRATASVLALAIGAIALYACRRSRDSTGAWKEGQASDLLYPRVGAPGRWLPAEAREVRREASGTLAPAWDWNGIIGTGQSLAVGAQGGDVPLTVES